MIEGFVCVFCAFPCVFCCHPCIQEMFDPSKRSEKLDALNVTLFAGNRVLSIGTELSIMVNTDYVPQNVIMAIARQGGVVSTSETVSPLSPISEQVNPTNNHHNHSNSNTDSSHHHRNIDSSGNRAATLDSVHHKRPSQSSSNVRLLRVEMPDDVAPGMMITVHGPEGNPITVRLESIQRSSLLAYT